MMATATHRPGCRTGTAWMRSGMAAAAGSSSSRSALQPTDGFTAKLLMAPASRPTC